MDLFSNLQLLHEAAMSVLVTTMYGRWRTITIIERTPILAPLHSGWSRFHDHARIENSSKLSTEFSVMYVEFVITYYLFKTYVAEPTSVL